MAAMGSLATPDQARDIRTGNTCKLNPNSEDAMTEPERFYQAGDPALNPYDGLKFYCVRNSEGKFFRAKDRLYYSRSWVADIQSARFYVKIGQAKSIATWFARYCGTYPIPVILEIAAGSVTVLDQTERVKEVNQKKETAEQRNKLYWAKKELEAAQRNLERVTQNFKGV